MDHRIHVVGPAARAAVLQRDPTARADQRTALDQRAVVGQDGERPDRGCRTFPFEHAHEGQVSHDPFGVDSGRHDVASPHLATVTLLGIVAPRLRERVEELTGRRRLADLLEEVDQPAGVAQHLHGLDAREIVEEPATRRVHEQCVALRFE